jgi:serine/threonine-protein kinase
VISGERVRETTAHEADRRAAEVYEVTSAASILRDLFAFGAIAPIVAASVDWVYEPDDLAVSLAVRAFEASALLLAAVAMRRAAVTTRFGVASCVLVCGGAVQIAEGAMAANANGFASCYPAASAFVFLLVAMAGLPIRLGASLIVCLTPLCHLAAVGVAAARGRALLGDARSVALAAAWGVIDAGLAVLAALAGDRRHCLVRELYETRGIGRYELRRRIRQSGAGEVWSAFHRNLRRDVAVRILPLMRAGASTARVAHFEAEIHATSTLTHPNTVRVLDCGVTTDGHPYYAMELVDGDSLADVIRNAGPLPARRAVRIVRQAAGALAEAHARGIVHRDVKPESILLTTVGRERDFVKLIDFGVADLDADADPREDVHALGVTLHWALAGKAPAATTGAGGIHPELDAIIARCTSVRRDRRYADAAEVEAALALWENAVDSQARRKA